MTHYAGRRALLNRVIWNFLELKIIPQPQA
jgi:hypothetical protein